MAGERCNGIRIRGLNADCDKLAVQSSEDTTWLLGRRKFSILAPKWQEKGLGQNEIVVLRPYGGCPEVEIEPMGHANAVLIVDQTQTRRQTLRVGRRLVLTLKRDEAVVIHNENVMHPNAGFGPVKAV